MQYPVSRTLTFSINTHNPNTEDSLLSYAVHNNEIYRQPLVTAMAEVLMNPGVEAVRRCACGS